MKSVMKFAALAATFFAVAVNPAIAVTWTFVQDVLIEENQGNPSNVSISGFFEYDSDTQSFGAINLVVSTIPLDPNDVASLAFDGTYTLFESAKKVNEEFHFSTAPLSTAGGLTGYLNIKFSSPLLNEYDPTMDGIIVAASADLGNCQKFDNVSGKCTQTDNFVAGNGANITSPGLLTNVSQIPIPLTWPLLLSSLVGLGFLSRRRAKTVA